MSDISTAHIIEVGKALLPYLRNDLSAEELGRACHDTAAALLRARLGDVGLSNSQRCALSCGNDPYADFQVCKACSGHGYVPMGTQFGG
jgi:hypothetical protein